ncbi:hypothetical protein BS78_05G223100 [Paspalum vaginatum]|nr:hypothetical protein BS78_05G223100 [Paspalum vaginatum]
MDGRGVSYIFSMNFAYYLNTIEPLSSTNYPTWNEKVQVVLKVLDLDYTLNVDKPVTPSLIYDNYVDKMREYTANSEKWEKSNRLSKMIIKHSISADLRGAFPDKINDIELPAKDGLSEHVKRMFNMAIELNELGVFVSDDALAQFIMSTLPKYHAQDNEIPLVCNFCKVPGHVMSQMCKV